MTSISTSLFGGDGGELLFDVIYYLIERGVIDIVADADGVFLFGVSVPFCRQAAKQVTASISASTSAIIFFIVFLPFGN